MSRRKREKRMYRDLGRATGDIYGDGDIGHRFLSGKKRFHQFPTVQLLLSFQSNPPSQANQLRKYILQFNVHLQGIIFQSFLPILAILKIWP